MTFILLVIGAFAGAIYAGGGDGALGDILSQLFSGEFSDLFESLQIVVLEGNRDTLAGGLVGGLLGAVAGKLLSGIFTMSGMGKGK